MKNFEFDHLIRELKRSSAPVVIFGTKKVGSLTYHALTNAGIKIDYFCDDAESALNKKSIYNIPIISSKELQKLDPELNVFIGAWVVYQILIQLIFYQKALLFFLRIYFWVLSFFELPF